MASIPHLPERQVQHPCFAGPLDDLATRVSFEKGALLATEGEPCHHLQVIEQGQVLVSRRRDGGEAAMYLLGPGSLLGEGALGSTKRWSISARALTPGTLRIVAARNLPRLGQFYPQLVGELLAMLAGHLERAHQRVELLCTVNAEERLLRYLQSCASADLRSDTGERWVPLECSQAEIGQMLGLARETVSRAFAELETCGSIRRVGRQGVWLRHSTLAER